METTGKIPIQHGLEVYILADDEYCFTYQPTPHPLGVIMTNKLSLNQAVTSLMVSPTWVTVSFATALMMGDVASYDEACDWPEGVFIKLAVEGNAPHPMFADTMNDLHTEYGEYFMGKRIVDYTNEQIIKIDIETAKFMSSENISSTIY